MSGNRASPFSKRWAEALLPNRLARATARRREEGAPLLDLTDTNPTRASLLDEEDLALPPAAAAAAPYAPDCRGLLPAREAVSGYYREAGLTVSPRDIFLTASTSEAYAFLFKLLSDPGDSILFPVPSYPLFEHLAAMESIEARQYPLSGRPGGGWVFDPEAIVPLLGPRARAVCLVSPNNPTGTLVEPPAWGALLEICRRRGLPIIVDEVFADYAWAGGRPILPPGEPEVPVFVLNGLSKVLCAPHLKLAWICLHGPEEARRRAAERLELICDTYLSVNAPVQRVLGDLLARRGRIQAKVARRLGENRAALAGLPGECPIRPLPAQGGWSQVLALPEEADEEGLALALAERHGVLVHPGYFFDIQRGAHLVVSLLPPPGEFSRGIAILRGALEAGA